MNPLKKIYCRTYQTAFRIAIPFLPYKKPKVLGSVSKAATVLKSKKIDSVLLVTDPQIRQMGITKPLEDALLKNRIHVAVYDKTQPNPTTEDVENARRLYVSQKCSAIIGFGGGSSMDCAKAVGATIARPNKPLSKMEGVLKVLKKIPLLLAIPTTAGTGSETTLAAVITDAKTRHKYPINDFVLIPKYAVLDPNVTLSLPPSLTATTGMDALTHAVEAYIGNSTTKDTRKDALKAVNLIFDNIFDAYNDGSNIVARRNMLRAAYYAGNAFTKSYVGYVHAVAHSLGGQYNTPHGLANAVLLPFVLESYGKSAYKKLHQLGIAAKVSTNYDSDEVGAKKFIQAIKDMKKKLNIGDTISSISEKDIPTLAKYADKEANPLYPVPKLMDAKELQKFYYAVMEGNNNG